MSGPASSVQDQRAWVATTQKENPVVGVIPTEARLQVDEVSSAILEEQQG